MPLGAGPGSPGESAPSGQEANIAKIAVLPNREIIDKYKGKLDFYTHRGLFCVRKWPLHPPRAPYPTEGANQDLFAYIMHLSPTLPANIKTLYEAFPTTKYFRWQDWLVRTYISGIDYHIRFQTFLDFHPTLPPFTITSLNLIQLGQSLTIEWETDIPCRQIIFFSVKSPNFVERAKYRRGSLWYRDWAIYLDVDWSETDPYAHFSTHHQQTLYGPAWYQPLWAITYSYSYTYPPPYYARSKATSPIIAIPQIFWEP